MTEASLIEIFSSIQGEGPYLGCQQVFVRFVRCNLDCEYCDTPFTPNSHCRVETGPGTENFRAVPNPLSGEQLLDILTPWVNKHPGLYHSISLTGGEPLLQADVLGLWLPRLRSVLPIYLETNGTLVDELETVISDVDIISMDIKLPSVTLQDAQWDRHHAFLDIASRKDVFVKVVFGRNTPLEEIEIAARLVAEVAPDALLVLQPLTSTASDRPTSAEVQKVQQFAAGFKPGVRVIPQTHIFMGVL